MIAASFDGVGTAVRVQQPYNTDIKFICLLDPGPGVPTPKTRAFRKYVALHYL